MLLVVDGPLRDSEYQPVADGWAKWRSVCFVCINKVRLVRRRGPRRESLRGQLCRTDCAPKCAPDEDVVASSALNPLREREAGSKFCRTAAKRKETGPGNAARHPADLADRMMGRSSDAMGSDLLLANLLLQSRGLVEDAQQRVRECDRSSALGKIVDRNTCGAAGGAAALSPLPLLDLGGGKRDHGQNGGGPGRGFTVRKWMLKPRSNLLAQLGKNLDCHFGR